MKVIKSISRIKKILQKARKENKKVAFVPTMGYLHQGHLSLIKRARKESDFLVISIYVNPTQFGPKEDLDRYPRNLRQDKKLAKGEKVDIVFLPNDKQMYPKDYQTYVDNEGSLSKGLCGARRSGHFKGVCTIVTKLFNIVRPNVAYFGQKDYQQAKIIKQMVKDLNMDIKIKILPIVRENDGLALSSRNEYLSRNEREKAVIFYQSLLKAKKMIKNGIKDANRIKQTMRTMIKKEKVKVDYIQIVDADSLKNIRKINKKTLVAVAGWVSKTRLIDNILVKP